MVALKISPTKLQHFADANKSSFILTFKIAPAKLRELDDREPFVSPSANDNAVTASIADPTTHGTPSDDENSGHGSDNSDYSAAAKDEEKEDWRQSRNKRAAVYDASESEQDNIAAERELGVVANVKDRRPKKAKTVRGKTGEGRPNGRRPIAILAVPRFVKVAKKSQKVRNKERNSRRKAKNEY